MKNLLRRLQTLERSPYFQPPACALEQIESLALQSLPIEVLELIHYVLEAQPVEIRRDMLSEREASACAALQHALEKEAARAGFKSFAEAERRAAQGR